MTQLSELARDAQKQHADYTQALSAIVRTLGVTAIATAWLFASDGGHGTAAGIAEALKAKPDLWHATIAAVLALLLDLLQYAWGATLYGLFFWAVNAQLDPAGTGNGCKYRLSARVARFFLFFRYVESADHSLNPASRFPFRRDRFRSRLKSANQELTDLLDSPASPSWMSGGTNILFVAKLVALTWSYLVLLHYFLAM